ncbi:uncharacterized protein [Haliotis asinina]|uniref:uncharacterized protein n=1 Tax=Haliotis asinina TaxID=109174 RepID=UPI003532539A
MHASTILLVPLVLHFSFSVASEGLLDGTHDVALPGSVFQTFRRTTVEQCRRLCVYSSRCLSVNWSSSTRECQLNSKKGNVESLQVSDSNVYLPVQQNITQQGHPCVKQPCSTDHMCIPVNMAKGHACVRIASFIPQTIEDRMPSKTVTTTSAALLATLEETTSTATARISTTPATVATTSAAPPTPLAVSATTTTSISASITSIATTPYNGTCVTDIDCAVPPGRTCSNGVCICSIGYDMDETSFVCRNMTECTSFGSKFTLHVDKEIIDYDIDRIRHKTPAELEAV